MILFSFVIVIVCLFESVIAFVCYVSPIDNSGLSCNVSVVDPVLSPCYSLKQLSINDQILFNQSVVTLYLLPGRHVIPKNHTFLLADKSEVSISPWRQLENDVMIKCLSKTKILVHDVQELFLGSVHLSSCSIFLTGDILNFSFHVVIIRCVFSDSKDYAIVSVKNRKTPIKFNISIDQSSFLFNNGSIHCNSGPRSLPGINTVLTITNTKFFGSQGSKTTINVAYTDLEIQYCIFANNTGGQFGGTIGLHRSSALILHTKFENNHGLLHGGAISHRASSLDICDCSFTSNFAKEYGGAIYSDIPQQFVICRTYFVGNYANYSGGALYTEYVWLHNSTFERNFAFHSGGAIHFYEDVDDTLAIRDARTVIDSTVFYSNKAGSYGGAIYCYTPKEFTGLLFMAGGYSFMNSADYGGGFVYMIRCSVSFEGEYSIKENRASKGGAIFAKDSSIFRSYVPEVLFLNNTAEDFGGAIYASNSRIAIFPGGNVHFKSNVVLSTSSKGGAIFIDDSNCESITDVQAQKCSIEYIDSRPGVKRIFFSQNVASYGSVLYGGLLDRCYNYKTYRDSGILGIEDFKQVSEFRQNTDLAITSEAVRVCICLEDFQPDCTVRDFERTQMRGETIQITVTSVDQNENPVPSVIRANYEQTTASLGEGEGRYKVVNCTTLSYHVFSTNSLATLILLPEGRCERSPFSKITMNIELVNCSLGFELQLDRCICDRRLTIYLNITVCNIDKHSVEMDKPTWFRIDEELHILRLAKNCPLDYCEAPPNTISLSSPDKQCADNRSGLLCGGCRDNYSVVLGSSRCLECTHSYYNVFWLVPVFTFAGIALVAFLLICNLTISHGTLNGLVFYANVVSIAGLASLQDCSLYPVLSVFTAWVNLEFGVETCFYSGMDAYQKTWLQFAFPLYIWLLVVAIIVASYYSSTAMKLFGRNNLAILATLFLLSYSKLLKTIISALRASQVLVSDADNVSAPVVSHKVWTYDGNVEYAKGKHAVLFAAAILFLVILFLPYTLLLTFGQCMRSLALRRRRWLLRLIRSTAFISILDAYHAPYYSRHRYWTGLLLLTRCVLFLAFTTSSSVNEVVANSYITLIIISVLVLLKTCSTKVYRNLWMNTLELYFLFNLQVLSATLYYLKGTNIGGNAAVCKTVNASISMSFVGFAGIVMYHAYLRIQGTKWYGIVKQTILSKWPARQEKLLVRSNFDKHHTNTAPSVIKPPTTSLVELREELLSSTDEDM